jgi:hypothetical protein
VVWCTGAAHAEATGQARGSQVGRHVEGRSVLWLFLRSLLCTCTLLPDGML